MEHATREREELAALLGDLTADELDTPSLCPGWTVRDVAVHVVSYDGLSWFRLPAAFLRGGFDVDRINEQVLRMLDHVQGADVADAVASRRRPRGLTAGFGGRIALTDGLIHHQDIRRALDRPRTVAPEVLVTALDFALRAPTIPASRNARGLHLVASDCGWSHGRGEEVSGPGEAVLMAVAGRPHALGTSPGPA